MSFGIREQLFQRQFVDNDRLSNLLHGAERASAQLALRTPQQKFR